MNSTHRPVRQDGVVAASLDRVPLLPMPRQVRPQDGYLQVACRHDNGTWPPTFMTSDLPAEGYRLAVSPDGVLLEAADDSGAFYGRMTLHQLLRVSPGGLPCGVIEDWPDIPVRGVMLDISRDKVPTPDTLYRLVDTLSEWKVNHLELYMEHTFAYRNHRTVWESSSPWTAAEIRALDAYCRERCMELVPNQNTFGHFERWLKHPRYRTLAECPDGFEHTAGQWRSPSTLNPHDPGSRALIAELIAELVPNFTSRRFHIGCDETWELGRGRCRSAVERDGLARVYVDCLAQIKALATAHGCTPLYWGDMIWKQFPDQLDLLDPEMIHVDWGYVRNYPFAEHAERLTRAGVPFWVAPGTSTWCTLVGCNEAAFGSNRSATRCAVEFDAGGCLNTDWGDGGHWQQLPVSFIGFAAGAAMAWCEARNPDTAIRAALNPHVFEDAAGVAGDVAYELAETWTYVSENATQGALLDRMLRTGLTGPLPEGVTEATLRETHAHLEVALRHLSATRMCRSDAGLIVDEFTNSGRMAQHACRLGMALARDDIGHAAVRRTLAADMREIIHERQRLWLARNRPGGLPDSLLGLEALVRAYEAG